MTEAAYEAARIQLECDYFARCCQLAGLSGKADCEEAVAKGFDESRPAADVDVPFDGAAAAACVRAIEEIGFVKVGCDLHVKDVDQLPSIPVCGRVYGRGDKQPGERCEHGYSPFECARVGELDTVCGRESLEPGPSKKICLIVKPVGEGEPCVGYGDEPFTVNTCAPGLLCDDAGSGMCVRPAERGQTCLTGPTWGDTCAKGSVCDRVGTKRCIAPAAVGSPCEIENTCEAMMCIGGVCREPQFSISGVACEP